MAVPSTFRQWIFERPLRADIFTPDCLAFRELPMPEPEPSQALVRVRLINIHSATRSRMASGATRQGETDRSNYACAEVAKSRDPAFREGDVLHSLADTSRARQLLGYEPTHSIEEGLDEALDWYERSLS